MRGATLALLAALVGCRELPEPEPQDISIYAHVLRAWMATPASAELPPVRMLNPETCSYLHLFAVAQPEGELEYARRCVRTDSWACLSWSKVPGTSIVRYYPVAVIHDTLPPARAMAAASHELLHAFASCAGLGYDLGHSDLRIWEEGGAGSVETRAERALYQPVSSE